MRLSKKISTEHNAKDGPRTAEHGILNCRVLSQENKLSRAEEGRLDREKQYHHLHADLRPRGNSPTVHNNPNLFKMCLFTALISTVFTAPTAWKGVANSLFLRAAQTCPKLHIPFGSQLESRSPSPEPYRKSPVTARVEVAPGWRQSSTLMS